MSLDGTDDGKKTFVTGEMNNKLGQLCTLKLLIINIANLLISKY